MCLNIEGLEDRVGPLWQLYDDLYLPTVLEALWPLGEGGRDIGAIWECPDPDLPVY